MELEFPLFPVRLYCRLYVSTRQNLHYASLLESLGKTAEKLSKYQGDMVMSEEELRVLSLELQTSLDEAKLLSSTLSGLVSTVEQELNLNVAPKSPDQPDAVEISSILEQVETGFSAIDREIELLLNPEKLPNVNVAVSVSQPDEDLSDIDQALQALQQADKVSKEAHVTQMSQSREKLVSSIPHLF